MGVCLGNVSVRFESVLTEFHTGLQASDGQVGNLSYDFLFAANRLKKIHEQ